MRDTAYSYRNDPSVPAFDDTRPIVIFDGLCVLCSAGVQWMLDRDPNGESRFAVAQDPVPRALYRHYGLDTETFVTFMVLKDGLPYTRWAGILAAAQIMPQPWRALGVAGHIVPEFVGDRIYDWIARNRYRMFPHPERCMIPPRWQKRFLA